MSVQDFAKGPAPGGNYPVTVQKLMERRTAAAADPAAFFDEFYPSIHRFIAATTGAPEADVEDLVQETLLGAWKSRREFRGEASPLTWVLGVARNQIRARGRAEGRRSIHERAHRTFAVMESELIPEELLETVEVARRVRRALLDLDDAHAEVLIRRYFDGASVRAIAEEGGESERAVQSRLHRAREALRDRLKHGVDDGNE